MTDWQVDAHAVTDRLWDVVIVGGGPAGAVAALHLARGGCSVVVLERGAYPRKKVCGDALVADSIRALDHAGLLRDVEARAVEVRSLRLFSPSLFQATIPTRALVIKRTELDEMVARAATAAGAVVAQGHVERVDAGKVAEIAIRNIRTRVKAKIAIVATGADVRLLAPSGMVSSAKPSIIGVRRYIRSTATIDHLVFSFDRDIAPGYAWVFPLGGGEFNVGCGIAYGHRRVDLTTVLDRFIHRFEPLRLFAEGITDATPVEGAVLRSGLTGSMPWQPPNVLAIGESIGTTLPLTGAGIGKAMETGERAAAVVLRALAANDLSILATFPMELMGLRTRYRRYQMAEGWLLAYPWLIDLLIRLACRSRHAAQCAAAVLNESGHEREIFSIRSLFKLLRS